MTFGPGSEMTDFQKAFLTNVQKIMPGGFPTSRTVTHFIKLFLANVHVWRTSKSYFWRISKSHTDKFPKVNSDEFPISDPVSQSLLWQILKSHFWRQKQRFGIHQEWLCEIRREWWTIARNHVGMESVLTFGNVAHDLRFWLNWLVTKLDRKQSMAVWNVLDMTLSSNDSR